MHKNDMLNTDCVEKTEKRKKSNLDKQSEKHLVNASFLALLIRSFVSFSLIIIIGVIAIFGGVNWAVSNEARQLRKKTVADYETVLQSGDFNSIPVKKLLGDDGWLEIVTTKGEVVYSSKSQPNTYTLGELDVIQKLNSGETIAVQNYKTSQNKYNYLITKTVELQEGKIQEQYLLLDNDYKIVSGSIATTKTEYTQREFEYLTFNATHERETLTRFDFVSSDGKIYYAVSLNENEVNNTVFYFVIIIIVVCIIALFAAVMVLYITYINKHVQKPLNALSVAMTDFARGNYNRLNYKGSKEFEHLYDSFNEMVKLLDESEKQRKALEADKQRMLAGLSHDLKTPITIIQGFAKAINDGIVSKEDEKKYLQLIVNKSASMSELVNKFYEYNKLEHPDFALERSREDVAELARSFLAGIYDEFEVRGYKLDTQIVEEELFCNVDKQQILRVFENLVGNFFKYTPIGSTLLFVVKKEGNTAKISLADNGPGISDEAKGDLFEAFVVGEKSRSKQGSGLGLAVCKKIISMHGGTIELAKDVTEGYSVQFDITLESDEK